MHTLRRIAVIAALLAAWAFSGNDRAPLARTMNGAWTSFARDGVPVHASLPTWPRYEPTDRSTMVFDRSCSVRRDPLGDDRRAWAG
jgi:para-nitrobenzyl esterase